MYPITGITALRDPDRRPNASHTFPSAMGTRAGGVSRVSVIVLDEPFHDRSFYWRSFAHGA